MLRLFTCVCSWRARAHLVRMCVGRAIELKNWISQSAHIYSLQNVYMNGMFVPSLSHEWCIIKNQRWRAIQRGASFINCYVILFIFVYIFCFFYFHYLCSNIRLIHWSLRCSYAPACSSQRVTVGPIRCISNKPFDLWALVSILICAISRRFYFSKVLVAPNKLCQMWCQLFLAECRAYFD